MAEHADGSVHGGDPTAGRTRPRTPTSAGQTVWTVCKRLGPRESGCRKVPMRTGGHYGAKRYGDTSVSSAGASGTHSGSTEPRPTGCQIVGGHAPWRGHDCPTRA